MNIKITNISIGIKEFISHIITTNCWDELGLDVVDKIYYTVTDKSLFMLAVVKYGIEFEEVNCSV